MSEFQIKLAGALPKGDPNGWADEILAEELARTVTEGRQLQPRAAVIIYDAKSVNLGTDGTVTVNVRVRRVQPVVDDAHRRSIEQILVEAYRAQTGAAILPFDVESVTKAAFVDLPKTDEEIDQQEAEEQDNMSPTDELRRHLERVHGVESAHLMTAEEADAKHEAEHDGDMPDVLAHDRDWLGWTRADLEAAEAESEESGAGADDMVADGDETGVDDGDSPHPDGTGEEYSEPGSLFDDGTGNR